MLKLVTNRVGFLRILGGERVRRCFLILVLGTLVVFRVPMVQAGKLQNTVYRIGLTTVFLDDQTSFLNTWSQYLQRKLGRPVEFVQRKSYREINKLLINQELDAAWICGLPYTRMRAKNQVNLLAVALYQNQPLYQSYLIVPASDQTSSTIEDLKKRVFAYSDPDSNSGFLVPQVMLLRLGINPNRFFAKSFFTWSHRDVIVAVAEGLAQGGSVDGYVWETLAKIRPDITAKTRVLNRSPQYGFPPFVVRTQLPAASVKKLRDALVNMTQDRVGRQLLRRLNLNGFVNGNKRLFDSIASADQYYEKAVK